ncbi:YHYH domain-containing protein [Aquipseudomonas alcaligenes]
MAHSGGTNANGCHTDHSTDDYHCHSARAEGAYERGE